MSRQPSTPYFDVMLRHLTEATLELFAAYGISVERCRAPQASVASDQERYCMASIGYVGCRLRGALVVAASDAAAEAWLLATGIEATGVDVADTLGEFSNMLLGRLKGKLLAERIGISVATPMTVYGSGLRFSVPPGQSNWHFFQGPGWSFGTRLDATFDHGFELQKASDERAAQAGDETIF